MKISSIVHVFAAASLLCFGQSALAQIAPQKTFAAPEDAVVALVDATATSNTNELRAIFGPDGDKLIQSGDPVMDQRNREVFLVAYGERGSLMEDGPARRVLYIGNEDWPFPIPLVKEGQAWRFDTAAGAKEILVRRIGRNELSTIKVCQVYVDAQNEYAAAPHDFQPSGFYAQRFVSSFGKHDGLYWRSEGLEEQSPLGQFAADAAAEGYRRAPGQPAAGPVPFHGYLYRILTAEGSTESPRSYIVNGQMRKGFALIAYPAQYGVSGVMSFIVNQDGLVYEKDLGANTAAVAAKISRYDPADGWNQVGE
jgi:hypothetical protein